MGKFGLGEQNEAEQRLTEFCQENTLVIVSTLFQQHKRWLYVWTSPDAQYQNHIDESALRIRWSRYWSFSFSIVPPMNIQDWFSLGLTSLISLQSNSMDMSLSKLWEMVKDREAWCASVQGATKSWMRLSNWTTIFTMGFPGGPGEKNPAPMQKIWIPSLVQEDFLGERNGSPLQSSCMGNPIDKGAWWATVHGVAKS